MLPCYLRYINKQGDGLVLHDRKGEQKQGFQGLPKKPHNGLFILSIREP